jgi:hypothetical protein
VQWRLILTMSRNPREGQHDDHRWTRSQFATVRFR